MSASKCRFHDVIEVLRCIISPEEGNSTFGDRLLQELQQAPGFRNVEEDGKTDAAPLSNSAPLSLDSCFIDDSASLTSSHSNSDSSSMHDTSIESAPQSPIDDAKAKLLFTEGMMIPRLAALSDERIIVFSMKGQAAGNITQFFSIVRDEHYCYFGWFSDLTSISGIGYSFNSDGSYYRGNFKNGEKNGYGEFFYDNGSHYNGYWECNNKQGSGRFYFNDDLFYMGRWDNNKMIDCELQYSSQIADTTQVYRYITTRNDYIFFKQSQLSSEMDSLEA